MRCTLLILALLVPTALTAQEPELPQYTPDQRWERISTLSYVSIVASIRHAKEMGQSVEEFAHWWADLFDDSWGEPGSYGPAQVMRGMRRNWLSFHKGEVDVLEMTDDVARARFSRAPYLEYFGDDGTSYGVTVEEYEMLNDIFAAAIADYHGLVYEGQINDDGWVMTFRRP